MTPLLRGAARRCNALSAVRTFAFLESVRPARLICGVEEGVGQRNLPQILHIRVIPNGGIDIENHRHINGLPRLKLLIFEAETLDFRKVAPGLKRRHVERCRPPRNHRFRLIFRHVFDLTLLTNGKRNRPLLGPKFPVQRRFNRRCKQDLDFTQPTGLRGLLRDGLGGGSGGGGPERPSTSPVGSRGNLLSQLVAQDHLVPAPPLLRVQLWHGCRDCIWAMRQTKGRSDSVCGISSCR